MTCSEPVGSPALDLALPYYRSQGFRTVGAQKKEEAVGSFHVDLGTM